MDIWLNYLVKKARDVLFLLIDRNINKKPNHEDTCIMKLDYMAIAVNCIRSFGRAPDISGLNAHIA
jgi:hypothetical protein